MNLEEKIEYIKDVAMTEARQEGNEIVEKYEESLQHIYDTHKKEMEETAKTRIAATKTSSKQKLNATISQEQLKIKKEFNSVQREIKKKIFDEVRELMNSYMATDDYKDHLVRYINDAAKFADGSSLVIYINASDEKIKDEIEKRTSLSLKISEDDFYGGIRAIIPDKNILIDHSYKAEMDKQYDEFTFDGGIKNA